MSDQNWTSQIVNHTWQYANVPNDTTGYDASTDAKTLYTREVGLWAKRENKGTITNKIGLMYAHDYPLATSNSALCHYNTGSAVYDKCKASWIHLNNNDTGAPYDILEWTVSRHDKDGSWAVGSKGDMYNYYLYLRFSVRPVFYLSEKIQLKEGTTGAINNPYIIEGVSE